MNNWGQGASNTNGWGQGAANNTINWGSIHALTYGHPETNLVGLNQAVIDFITRVVSDGGSGYSLGCLNSKYNFFFDSVATSTISTFDLTFDNTFN